MKSYGKGKKAKHRLNVDSFFSNSKERVNYYNRYAKKVTRQAAKKDILNELKQPQMAIIDYGILTIEMPQIIEICNFNKDNFYLNTITNFINCKKPSRNPDYTSIYKRKKRVYKDNLFDWDVVDYSEDESDLFEVTGVGEVGTDFMDEEYMIYYNIIAECGDYYLAEEECKGKISSEYWYSEEGVIRKSDHWGVVATCEWNINEGEVGFAKWNNFTLKT